MMFNQILPSVQPQSFLEWTLTSFEQSVAEFYTIYLEEHLQSCFRDVGGGNLFLTLVIRGLAIAFLLWMLDL
jgi:hypothetical protein